MHVPDGWRFVDTSFGPSGGQGTFRVVENIATSECGFATFLTENNDLKAWHRLDSKVAAYETLVDAPNLLRLLAHTGGKFDTGAAIRSRNAAGRRCGSVRRCRLVAGVHVR